MVKRVSRRRVSTEEVQGEGSYVVVTGVKVREIKALRKTAQDPNFDIFVGGLKLLQEHIVEWNWVDDEGDPLLCPKDDPDVIDELTEEEATFLSRILTGEEEAKN